MRSSALRLAEELVVGAALDLGDSLRRMASAEAVIARESPEGVQVLVIVNNASVDDRRAIYSREWELMRQHLEASFQFRVLDRRDQPLCDVVSLELHDVFLRVLSLSGMGGGRCDWGGEGAPPRTGA